MGQGDEVGQLMLQWLEKHPDDIAVRLTRDIQLDNDLAAAQEQYLAVVALDSTNVTPLTARTRADSASQSE